MSINTIQLDGILPRVFRDSQGNTAVTPSGVWLSPLTFRRQEAYMIAAESGAGKSSLCSFIYGNRDDYEGRILFDGIDIREFSIDKWCAIRCESLALLPQEMRIFPELTAMDNVLLKNRLTDRFTAAEIRAMFDRLDISGKADVAAGRLSVGQQQRVAIIRSLCQPFSFILLDEPVSHLDERNNRAAAMLITEIAASQQAAIIATSVGNPLSLDNFISLSL